MKVDLEGKFALVTGAARGIGRSIADTLTANGAAVAYADINFTGVKESAAGSRDSLAVEIDISNEQSVESALAKVLKQFGRLDILVNNAGVNTAKHRVNVDQFPLEEWDRIVKIDLKGTFLVSRSASGIMLKQKDGHIINIASVLGVIPARLQCAFTSAKAGIVHLTRTMAIELGEHGILVNCVAPGSTLTEGTKRLFYGENAAEKDRAQRVLSHIPLGRVGTVEEMATPYFFSLLRRAGTLPGKPCAWMAAGALEGSSVISSPAALANGDRRGAPSDRACSTDLVRMISRPQPHDQ